MATVSKQIADEVITGKYPEDRIVKIVRYTNAWGGESYGLIAEGKDLDYYAPSPYVRNPFTYWERPK